MSCLRIVVSGGCFFGWIVFCGTLQLPFIERVFVLTVNETNTSEQVFEVGVASEFSPAFRRTLSKLEHHCQRHFCRTAASGLSVAEPDRGERTFDRVSHSDVAPVLRWKVVEREQFVAIFGQALGSLKVLRFERVQEEIEGLVGSDSRRSLPDVVQ